MGCGTDRKIEDTEKYRNSENYFFKPRQRDRGDGQIGNSDSERKDSGKERQNIETYWDRDIAWEKRTERQTENEILWTGRPGDIETDNSQKEKHAETA
jgi:hypothetical protein